MRRSAASKKPPARIMKNISGLLRPGTSTIILAAAGAGASTLLRIIAGRQQCTGGKITWNGRTSEQLASEGVVLRKVAGYCPEGDDHEALLTVAETFQFAFESAVASAPASGTSASLTTAAPGGNTWSPPTAADMMRSMGLEGSEDTYIGSSLVRGVSGGQKRRVTLGETLLLNSRILALDGPTNGLDAVTAHHVMQYVVEWARTTHGVAIATLQQPLPETFALFDDVILLADGRVLYHGPSARMDEYLSSVGYVRPSYMDPAAWAVEIVSSPMDAAVLSLQDCNVRVRQGLSPGDTLCYAPTLLTIDALADHWDKSEWAAIMMAGSTANSTTVHVSMEPSGAGADGAVTSAAESAGCADTTVVVVQHAASDGNTSATNTQATPSHVPDAAPMLVTPYARAQYGSLYTAGFGAQVKLTTSRELRLARRNWLYSGARIANAIVMGAVLGTVFIQLSTAEFALFFSVSLFAVTFVSFLNNAIVPIAMASRTVVYRHTAAGLYSEFSYNLAVLIGHLPISIVADFLFATILYWIVGYVADVARWLVFVLVIFGMDLCISVLYRSFSYATPSQELAMIVSSLFTAVGLSTGGFFVVRNQVPPFLVWLLYISPFFWSVDAIANNEFSASKYAGPFGTTGQSLGEAFMGTFSFLFGVGWKWFGIGLLFGYYFFFGLLVQPLLLRYIRYDVTPGSMRVPVESEEEAVDAVNKATMMSDAGSAKSHATLVDDGACVGKSSRTVTVLDSPTCEHQQESKAAPYCVKELESYPTQTDGTTGAQEKRERATGRAVEDATRSNGLPSNGEGEAQSYAPNKFAKVALVFCDVTYSVPSKKRGGSRRQLLRGVNGLALPGTLTALCGASGAGKTTLLDVLAFRKTTGTVGGQIQLNGSPATPAMFARASCFAEQFDEHLPTTSVREALQFSVALRTARDELDTAGREAVVADVLETLELQRLAERQVSTLSRGELKRLSLAVELASLSGLVFADEPTTGLSARAASVVVRCLQRIAAQGRTVVCTIHQPSAHLFFAFTHLLLLAPGGHQVYFGPLGQHASSMVAYFAGIPGVLPLPPFRNPATWMLDILESTPAPDKESSTRVDAPPGGSALVTTSAPASVRTTVGENQVTVCTDAPSGAAIVSGHSLSQSSAAVVPAPPPLANANETRTAHAPLHEHSTLRVIREQSPEDEAVASDGDQDAGRWISQNQSAAGEPTLPGPVISAAEFAAAFTASALGSALKADLQQYLHPEQRPSSDSHLHQSASGRGDNRSAGPPISTAVGQPGAGATAPTSGESELPVTTKLPLHPRTEELQPLTYKRAYAATWPTQARIVLDRALRDSWRNSPYTGNRILAIAFLGVFFGLLYLELEYDTFQGIQSATGAVLASMGFCGVVVFTIGVPLYMRYRASFYRERDAKFYSPSVHALSLLIVETLWVALLCTIFVAIFYYLIKFTPAFTDFLFYLLGTFICVLCFMFAALCAAAMFPSSIIAQLAGGVFLSVVFLFAGIFVPRPSMPRGWAWFMYADYAFHLVRAMALNQFVCFGGVDVCPSITLVTPSGPQTVTTYNFVSTNLGTGYETRWADMGIAALILVGFVIATFAVWQIFNHQKR